MNKISVIIPVKEEMDLQFHRKIIESYKSFSNCELMWVIGPNCDGTLEDLLDHQQRVIQTNSNSRAERINIGINATRHPLVLINHPRSYLSEDAIRNISSRQFNNEKGWGGFTHKFHHSNHPVLKFTSAYSNYIRFGVSGIVYLDHCIFFTRNMIDQNDDEPVPVVDIFEDTLLSKKFAKQIRPIRIKEISFTSSIRFNTNGIFRQSLMNQKLKIKNTLGFSKQKMNEDYEKNLNLNSEY